MTRVTPETVLFTPESCQEAVALRTYCESKFPVGEPTTNYLSVTGEPYQEIAIHIELGYPDYLSPKAARIAAQHAFDEYTQGKSGTLYWRSVPEIALRSRSKSYAYYMRLLISEKPVKDSN